MEILTTRDEGMSVSEAVASRRSVRAFTDEPVDRAVLEKVLETAQRAASGGNLQPWRAYVLGDEAMALLRAKVAQRLDGDGPPAPPVEYDIYPPSLWSPYRERRFANGEQLYAALEIPRDDKPARLGQFAKNWDFFGAPVGLMLYVDRGMGRPQWGDLGIWLQSVMLLLREAGLDSCPQEAWSAQHDLVAEVVRPPEELILWSGLAIGYADESAPVNGWRSDRAPLSESVTWLD